MVREATIRGYFISVKQLRRVRVWRLMFSFVAQLVFVSTFSSSLHAQTSLDLDQEPSLKTKIEPRKNRGSSFFNRSLTAYQHTYVSSGTEFFRDGAMPSVTNFDLRLFSKPSQSASGGVDIETRYNGGEDALYFRPVEFYGKYNVNEKSKIFLGRKKLPWSESDELWKRGLFQPRFMDDPLEAKTAGLIGLFFVRNSGRNQFFAFASPLFIPEFGPQTGIEDEKFVSRNPWFRPPADRLALENGIADIRFGLKTPRTEDVVLNGGGGFGYRYSTDANVFIQANYLYKPMNQFALGFPFVLNLGDEGETTAVELEITPRVSYHHIASATLGKNFNDGSRVYAEVIQEQPDDQTPPVSWISKQNGPATVATVTMEKSFSRNSDLFRKAWLSFSNLEGGDEPDAGNFASDQSLFENRYMFQQSAQIGWQGTLLSIRNLALRSVNRAIYDFKQRGYVVSTEWNLTYRKSWSGLFKAEFLGNTDLDGEIQNGFTSLYRANDRVSAGVRYVF